MLDKIPENLLNLSLEVLALTDALFVPCRHSQMPPDAIAVAWERRREFFGLGFTLTHRGDVAARVGHHRALQALAKAGVVRLAGRGKVRGVKLTALGDDHLRSLVACYRVDESWPLLERVALLARGTSLPVLENDLHGRQPFGSPEAVAIENRCLALLCRGLLRTNSDTAGRVAYALTAAGREALAAGKPTPPADLPEYDHSAAETYDRLFKDALAARENAQPGERDPVVIPLPAGDWPVPQGVAHG